MVAVYNTIVDLDAHEDWKPIFRLSGTPILNSEVGVAFHIAANMRPIRSVAIVTAADASKKFSWLSGIGWLFAVGETYRLEPDGGNTVLSHEVHFHGIFAPALRFAASRAITTYLANFQRCLLKQLERKRTKLSSAGKARS